MEKLVQKTISIIVMIVTVVSMSILGGFLIHRMFERQQLAYMVIALLFAFALLEAANIVQMKAQIDSLLTTKIHNISSERLVVAGIFLVLGCVFYIAVLIEMARVAIDWIK